MRLVSMDKLPDALLIQILSRLDDSADVASCRIAWKAFDNVYPHIRFINLQRTSRIYLNEGSRVSNSSQVYTPFKDIFLNLLSNLKVVETITISNESLITNLAHGITRKTDDLHLTDQDFVKKWLPTCSSHLKSLSISNSRADFCPRSHVLPLISVYCRNLVELKVKGALLSVEKLNPMPMLTSLTLEDVRVCDGDKSVIINCFPNLQALNLVGYKGHTFPEIDLPNLKTFGLTMYHGLENARSSVTLIAPNLITLKLGLSCFTALHVKAPILSHLHLSVDSPYVGVHELYGGYSQYFLQKVFYLFPNVNCLCFKSNAWSALEAYLKKPFDWENCDGMRGLKTFSAYLLLTEQHWTFLCVAYLLDQSTGLSEVSLLIRCGVSPRVSKSFRNRCMSRWPRLKWRWGIWSDAMEDTWVSI